MKDLIRVEKIAAIRQMQKGGFLKAYAAALAEAQYGRF